MNYSFSEDERQVITHRLQGDIGMTCLPCPRITWSDNVENVYPENNGHNTPYYKTKQVLHEKICQWLDDTVGALECAMPEMQCSVRYPKTKRCVKCNRAFFNNKGARLRVGCVVDCGCLSDDVVDVQMCTRCKVLQWLLLGCTLNEVKKMTHPMYNQQFGAHPGYVQCLRCKTLVTLANFRSVNDIGFRDDN